MSIKEAKAKRLQEKFESYMQDFANKMNVTVEEIIIKYAGKDGTKETMYNTDIVLGFLADYYGYYEHIYNLLNTDDEAQINDLKKKINELDEEYIIFEELIYGISEKISIEKKEGQISTLKPQEIKDGIKEKKEQISIDKMKEMSRWIRSSYYDYLEKYRNKEITLCLPEKRHISFKIEDDNLPHLLGIPNVGNGSFKKMKLIYEMSDPSLSSADVEAKTKKESGTLSFAKVKYKNFMFQNYRLIDSPKPLIVHYDVIPNANKQNDCDAYIITESKNKEYNRACLGLTYTKKNNRTMNCAVKSIFADKKIAEFMCEATKTSNITSIFSNPKNNPHQRQLIGIFSAAEQFKMIQDLLEEDVDEGRKLYNSLLPYFKRLYTNIERVELKINNIRSIKNDLENSRSI